MRCGCAPNRPLRALRPAPGIPGGAAFLLSLRNWSFAGLGLLLMESKWARNQEISTRTASATQYAKRPLWHLMWLEIIICRKICKNLLSRWKGGPARLAGGPALLPGREPLRPGPPPPPPQDKLCNPEPFQLLLRPPQPCHQPRPRGQAVTGLGWGCCGRGPQNSGS